LTALAADKEHGTLVQATTLYVAPGPATEQLMRVERGEDLVVLEKATVDGNRPWLKVFVTLTRGETVREVTGWLPSRAVVTTSTPNADGIIFGEATDSENQAEQRGGRKGAAGDAMRLYYRVADLFPSSPLAPEARWRSADIRWQLEKANIMSSPSQRALDPVTRNPMDERWMKEIVKKFPGTKWADLAAYEMIDNKLCGEWKGLAACPEKESEIYEKYAREHPRSPKAAEALYNAAWRQAALADIFRTNNEGAKSANARKTALVLAREIAGQYPEGDWKQRAMVLIFKLEQNVPVYGSTAE
jgi:hypothetical protein